MNMLLRLQEAANYSSTQSCDSDSTSHHDEQLDSSLESALWGRALHWETPRPLRTHGSLSTLWARRPRPHSARIRDIWKVLSSKMVYAPFEYEKKKHLSFSMTNVQYEIKVFYVLKSSSWRGPQWSIMQFGSVVIKTTWSGKILVILNGCITF